MLAVLLKASLVDFLELGNQNVPAIVGLGKGLTGQAQLPSPGRIV
jgi:hypothetical protein